MPLTALRRPGLYDGPVDHADGRRVTAQVEDAVAAVVEEKESDNVVRHGALCIGKPEHLHRGRAQLRASA